MLGENPEFNPGLKYAGQWLDDESGLVYNRFRYYSPVAGQYLTPILLAYAGALIIMLMCIIQCLGLTHLDYLVVFWAEIWEQERVMVWLIIILFLKN
ncbi:RHS repeat domain-containing protein, partial [Xenorhabdus eapokensis]|uniref:RHS repeat domain-containing protein n=1 Tax=Xenorhabdus eapokensis TaxID=1873482 RepID=UPI002448D623